MHEDFLRDTFQIATEARDSGDGAYGALILNESGEVIVRAGNTTSGDDSVTYHAEKKMQFSMRKAAGVRETCQVELLSAVPNHALCVLQRLSGRG